MRSAVGPFARHSFSWWPSLRLDLPTVFVYLAVAALGVLASVVSPAFLDPGNLTNVARQAIPLSLVVIGQTFVILTGGIDFSVGAIAGLVAVAAALVLAGDPAKIPVAFLLAGVIGSGIGLVTGVLVSRLNAMPFIVTFGMAGIISGVTLTVTDRPVGGVPTEFLVVYEADIAGMPISVLVTALLWLGAWYVLTRRPAGRRIYGIGGSMESARLSGVNIWVPTIAVYVVSGLFAAAAGLFLLARSGVGDPTFGEGLDFLSVTAAAIGGISLLGGRGSVIGALGGVLLLTVISNVFNLIQVDIFYRQVITGAIILAAVAAYRPRRSPLE